MTLVCTSCRRRFDLIVDTPYTRTLAAFMTGCPHCGGAVQRLSDLITASATLPLTFTGPVPDFGGLFQRPPTIGQGPTPTPTVPYELPTVPYDLTDDDRTFLRVNRIDPEI